MRIREADGSKGWAAGDALEKFLFDLGGAPRRFRSSLTTPWHIRPHTRTQQLRAKELPSTLPRYTANLSRAANEASAASPPSLVTVLSDQNLERHRHRLLIHLRGADGSESLAASSGGSNTSNSNGSYEDIPMLGRTAAEWLAPTRAVFAEEIWRRRYDFSSINKVLVQLR